MGSLRLERPSFATEMANDTLSPTDVRDYGYKTEARCGADVQRRHRCVPP